MVEEGLSVRFTGDTSGLESATKSAAGALTSLGKKSKESGAAVYYARDAVMDLGHVARDLPYAANNFSLLAGPIGKISTLMSGLTQQTGSFRGAMGALGSALSGPGGVVIGIELAVSAIALLSSAFSSTDEKAKQAGIGIKFYSDAIAESAGGKAAQSVANISSYAAALTDLQIPLRERTVALADYNKVADKQNQLSVQDLSNIGKINEAIGRQIELFKERALIKGAEDSISSLYKTIFTNQFKISDAADKFKKTFDISQLLGNQTGSVKQFTTEVGNLQDASKAIGGQQTNFLQNQIEDTQKKIGDLMGFIQRTIKEGDVFGQVIESTNKTKTEKAAHEFFSKIFDFDPATVQEGGKKWLEAYNAASEFAVKNINVFAGLDKIVAAPNREAAYNAALQWWNEYQHGILTLKPPTLAIKASDFPKMQELPNIVDQYQEAMNQPFGQGENLGILDPDKIKRGDIVFRYQNLFRQIGQQLPSIFDYTDDQGRKAKSAIDKIPTKDLANVLGKTLSDSQTNIKEVANMVSGTLTPAFQGMFSAIEQGKSPMQAFFNSLMQSVDQLIGKLIAAAIEAAVLSAFSGGGTSFVSAFGSALGFKVPGHAAGGIAFGPSLGVIGEYANAGSNPEVIAPLSKLKGMLSDVGGGSSDREIVIRGNDLVLVNSRVQRSQRRDR